VIIVTFVIRLNPGGYKVYPRADNERERDPENDQETTLRAHNIAMICLQTSGEESFTAEKTTIMLVMQLSVK
jgi:hypothetical protein